MIRLLVESYLLLLHVEMLLKVRNLRAIYDLVLRQSIAKPLRMGESSIEAICHAMDLACALYVKPVECLQRSAATTVLLKRLGWEAKLVIGAQVLPFKAHAWTEVGGCVVNDKPSVTGLYTVLDRC
jgi:hypothetical protein